MITSHTLARAAATAASIILFLSAAPAFAATVVPTSTPVSSTIYSDNRLTPEETKNLLALALALAAMGVFLTEGRVMARLLGGISSMPTIDTAPQPQASRSRA